MIFSVSCGFTSFTKYVLKNPINTAISDVTINVAIIVVTINVAIIVNIILPIRLGVFIFDIDVVIVKNISGTIITNKRFKNTSPNGFKTVALSWNITPTIAPMIIDATRIIVDL